ncbi:hypothetical protein BH09MYX1_BH09MYX1_08800 [soil metagenome]
MTSSAERSLDLSPPDRDLLASVWERSGKPPLRVDPADVASAAEAVSQPIPDLILAILIAEGRNPGAVVELTQKITTFYDAGDHRDWRRASQFDHVAFAELVTDDESEPVYACFARSDDPTKVSMVAWNLREPGRGGVPFVDLGAYVAQRDPNVSASRNGAEFRPVVCGAPKPVAGTALVEHKKFGEGRVVEELEDGKLRIDFGEHGVRVLASSFVTPKTA